MSTNIRFHFFATVMASLILLSCASTRLSYTWKDASYTSGPLKKILVVAVRKDQLRRRTWEDGFAAALSWHGVDATPSYRLITANLPDTSLINTVAMEGHFDGILLVGRVSAEITDDVTGSSSITSPDSPSQTWGGWNSNYYPGYPLINEIVKDEVKIRTTQGGGRLIWSGVGEVHESGEDENVSGEIIPLIVRELVKEGIIAAES